MSSQPRSLPPRLIRLVVCTGLALTASGCFTATFEDAAHPPTGEHHAAYRSHFLLGTVGGTHVDVRDYCRSGEAAEVQTGSNLGTMVITVLTVGIYTPRMVYFTCAPERAQ